MKKSIALLLSATMLLGSSITAHAEGEPATAAAAVTDGTAAGTSEVVNTTKYRVVVPTTHKLDYTADPQGLATLAKGATSSLDQLDGYAGYIYAKDTISIANRSSKDVDVTVKVSATTSTDENKVNATLSTFADLADDNEGATAVALALVPREATFAVDADAEDAEDTVNSVKTTYKVTPVTAEKYTGYEIGTAEKAITATLKRADYSVTRDATSGAVDYALTDATKVGGAVQFAIAGKTAKGEQWSNLTKEVGLPSVSIKFAFTDAGVAATDAYKVTNTGALATTDIDKLSATVEETADAVDYSSATAMTLTKGSTALYQPYTSLAFTKADITKIVADVDGVKTELEETGTDDKFKVAIDSDWSSATAVKIYVVTEDAVYAYTFK